MSDTTPHLDENGFVVLDADDPEADTFTHSEAAIIACHRCDSDGYVGHRVCDHREHARPETRAAAMDAIRAALGKGAR